MNLKSLCNYCENNSLNFDTTDDYGNIVKPSSLCITEIDKKDVPNKYSAKINIIKDTSIDAAVSIFTTKNTL